MKQKSRGKVIVTMSAKLKNNLKIYKELLNESIKYCVEGKFGLVPCIPVEQFSKIQKNLPELLSIIRYTRSYSFQDRHPTTCWRLSHGNGNCNLPEFTHSGHVFSNEWLLNQEMAWHKKQQFQEYDVQKLLEDSGYAKIKKTDRIEDPGAMRIIVDECFEHVYFSVNHYSPLKDGKDTKAQKDGKEEIEGYNAFIFVIFSDLYPLEGPPTKEKHEEQEEQNKKNPNPSKTDIMFRESNIVEGRAAQPDTHKDRKEKVESKFDNKSVILVRPYKLKRPPADGYVVPNTDT